MEEYIHWCEQAIIHLSMMETCDNMSVAAQSDGNIPLAIEWARTVGQHKAEYRIAMLNAEKAL